MLRVFRQQFAIDGLAVIVSFRVTAHAVIIAGALRHRAARRADHAGRQNWSANARARTTRGDRDAHRGHIARPADNVIARAEFQRQNHSFGAVRRCKGVVVVGAAIRFLIVKPRRKYRRPRPVPRARNGRRDKRSSDRRPTRQPPDHDCPAAANRDDPVEDPQRRLGDIPLRFNIVVGDVADMNHELDVVAVFVVDQPLRHVGEDVVQFRMRGIVLRIGEKPRWYRRSRRLRGYGNHHRPCCRYGIGGDDPDIGMAERARGDRQDAVCDRCWPRHHLAIRILQRECIRSRRRPR